MRLPSFLTPSTTVSAHCDLPCGVYDPAQARIEAQSVKAMQEKYLASDDEVFKTRALIIIDERATLAKHHLAVLWHDYFTAEHFEKYPDLHMLINNTIKAASGKGAKQLIDPAQGQKLLDGIDEIAAIFWETKGKTYEKPAS
jgi:nickel superoxide dismutase